MTKKIIEKKDIILNFLKTHKSFSIVVALGIILIILPLVFNKINAGEEDIDLQLKDASMENSVANPYIIDSVDDFIVLQEYSKTHDCYGMYFAVGDILKNNRLTYNPNENEEDEEGSEADGITYNMNLVGTIILEDGLSKAEFKGIGQNIAKPFRGNILFNGITIRIDTPLFCFVGSGASIEEVHLFGDVTADKFNTIVTRNAPIGMLAGMAVLDSTELPLNISNVSVSHNSTIVGSGKSVGGIVGMVWANPYNKPTNYQYDPEVSATRIDANTDRFVINLNTVTIPDAANFYTEGFNKTNSNYDASYINSVGMPHNNTPGYTGGIIGDVVSCNYNYYVDVNFTALQKDPQTGSTTENGATLVKGYLDNDKFGTGGVIGHIGGRVCVKFDCNIDVTGLEKADAASILYKGSVIGSMSRYAVCYMTEGHRVLSSTNGDLDTLNEVEGDGSGVAGTIFKNTEESFWTENVEISGDGTEANPYVIANAEDMERLSVLLSTAGRYGVYYDNTTGNWKSWFNVPTDVSGGKMTTADIINYVRRAYFSIEGDIDLSERNVVRINREDGVAFAGSIIGKQGSYKNGNEYPTLTLNATEYQAYVALIPYATGRVVDGTPRACEYKNFNLDGVVEGRDNVYGLIFQLDQRSNNANYGYSDYLFENIMVNIDMKQKSANNSNMSGFIGLAYYQNVLANLNTGLKLSFKDIEFDADMTTHSNGSSYGGALAGIIYIPANDMSNPDDINNFQITVDGYDYTGDIKCTSTSGHRVGAMIYQITGTANNYRNYAVAGRSVNFGKSAFVNISDVNVHDTIIKNGDGSGELGGILGYSWGYTKSSFKDISLNNVTFDTVGGYGAVFLSGHSGIMNIDGLNYDNVSIIRSKVGTNGQWNSSLFWTNTGVINITNHNVSESKFLLYAARNEISENVVNIREVNNSYRIETNGIFNLEGNAPDGSKYTAINSYESPYTYTDIATQTKNFRTVNSQIGTRMWYNVFTNMEGNTISGTGTNEDPFIIDNEAEMVLLSAIFGRHSVTSDMYEYFTDIDEIFTADELTSMPFTQKNAERTHRILTGVYVFAKDMDFSEYSFYPLNNPTGDYYGFDAYEYSGKASLTDEELKNYCATAISVLNTKGTVSGMTLEAVNNNKPEIHFRADRVAGLNINTDGSEKTPEQCPTVMGDGWNRPSSNYGIHRDIQSGLFCSVTGSTTYAGDYQRGTDVVINNIMLSGVVAKNNWDATRGGGAFLVTGNLQCPAIYYAAVDISNIDFGEAFIVQRQATGDTWTQASGLLVDTIGAGDVNITGIKVLQDAEGTANVRADALIGYQYGNTSRVILREIDLNAVIGQGTLSKSEQEVDGKLVEVVTINTSEKEGKWRSDNTSVSGKDATTGKYLDPYDEYGYGFKYGYYYFYLKEGAAIYYYDVGTDIVTPGRIDTNATPQLNTIQNKILLNSVQKYAYKVINVDVNPINNNITQGSGTESDPYIIDSVGQLLTLANYIKYEGDIIGYEDWWVGDVAGTGYDELDPDTWASNDNVLYANRYIDENNDKRLNAVRHLASSYYKITCDIDFTDPRSPFADMATNFNGVGTEAYPFSGGFIGEEKADGSNPVIYIGNSVDSYQKTFGLIRFGKGFEVSNLNFENGWAYLENIDDTTGEYSYTQTTDRNTLLISNSDTQAGMVASCILGGDNIIRDVNVDVAVQLEGNGNTTLKLGGYVGYMKAGTLKVTEMDEDTFADFKIGIKNAMSMPTYSDTVNPYVSALVGDVDAGFIMYEDETDTISKDIVLIDAKRVTITDSNGNIICKVPDIKYYNKHGIGLCNTSDPVNQAYLDNIVDTVGRIEIKYNGANSTEAAKNNNGMFIANLENEDHVYLYSLALKSGALSAVEGQGYYNNLSSCKKDEAEWADWLANENAGKEVDAQITLNDDWNFPAMFKYFDFSALDNSYKSVYYGNSSMLNMGNTGYQNSAIRRTTWTLTGPQVYDLSKFGDDFQGIGLTDATGFNNTDWSNSRFVTMCANFDGNGRTIYLELEKYGVAGLFTYLNTENGNNSPFVIKNFNLEGHVTQTRDDTANNVYARAAGVCGYLRYGWYNFDSITLQNLDVVNLQGGNAVYTAGIVTGCEQGTARFYNIKFGDPNSNDPANVLISSPNGTGGVAGGLMTGASRITAVNITMVNTTISTGSTVGGLVGSLGNNNGASNMDKITVTDCTFETRSNASIGGVVGNMYGNNNNNIISIHDVKVMDNNLIAPDGADKVGKIVGAHTGAYYNKKEILKIYDTDSKNFTGPTTDMVLNCYVTSDYEDCDYFYYNDFKDLEYAEALYDILREDENGNLLRDDEGKVIREDEDGNAIVRYAECIETDLFMAPDANNDGELEQVDLIPSTPEMDNTIVRWSSDSGTLENVLNSVLSSLTNGTGLINEDTNNNNITISVESLQINNGVISARPAGEESIFITQREGKYLITNNNKYDSIERDDQKTGEHIPGTFSLVHVTYSIGNGTYKETITIPVFVSNMVNVDIYSKLVIGEEYDVDIMRAIKRTAHDIQVTTKNSTYTVYTEFMYSSNRIDFDEELYMNKGFRLYDAPDPFVALGTKLTLIDLTFEDDPKVYYYEVDKSDTFIPLAWFKDENGVNYKERNLNILDKNLNGLPSTRSYTTMYVNQRNFKKYDRGIEKYLLIVDCSGVEQVGNETSFSPIIMDGVETGQDDIVNKEVFYIKYRTYNTLSTYNGRTVQFVDDSVVTQGEINKDKQLDVEVSFTDKATDFYWSDIKPYDYINQNKYLEVVAYLKNENGDKIMLPSGTRIKCNNPDAIYEGIKNTSAIFYYKDVIEDEKYVMLDKTKNTTTKVSFSLDFTYAKMEKLPSGNYTICFDLVRSFNPDFPMGDDLLDTIESDVIEVTANAEYGFRLETYGKDSLAFNIADVAEGTDSVVDFDVLLNSTLPDALARNKQIQIIFTLYKKDKDTGVYMPYLNTSDKVYTDIELKLTHDGDVITKVLNTGNLEYTINGITGRESDTIILDTVMTIPYNADINNYKLQAEMYVDGDRRASDFFIVNISNIKH